MEAYYKYLKKSIDRLKGDFSIISTDDVDCPAKNYNKLLNDCVTDFLILTHEDITFPSNLLEKINNTIERIGDWGVLGMVGVDKNGEYRLSNINTIYEVDTLDSCFIVIKKDTKLKFDSITFNDYHLYVEDLCGKLNRELNLKHYTILIDSEAIYGDEPYNTTEFDKLIHHSVTVNKLGFAWGKYGEFRRILEDKYPNIKTT